MGDINIDLLKGDGKTLIFQNLLSLGLDQLIWEITRPDCKACNCFDHIYITMQPRLNPLHMGTTHWAILPLPCCSHQEAQWVLCPNGYSPHYY